MSNKIVVEVQCDECQGTGLYSGFCEAKGEAVVCLRCNGSGKQTLHFTKFTGRKHKPGIKRVRLSRGSFIATGVGGTGASMTYTQFQEKYQ